jgi:hypothetical protein
MAIMNLISIEGHLCFIRAVAGKRNLLQALERNQGFGGRSSKEDHPLLQRRDMVHKQCFLYMLGVSQL